MISSFVHTTANFPRTSGGCSSDMLGVWQMPLSPAWFMSWFFCCKHLEMCWAIRTVALGLHVGCARLHVAHSRLSTLLKLCLIENEKMDPLAGCLLVFPAFRFFVAWQTLSVTVSFLGNLETVWCFLLRICWLLPGSLAVSYFQVLPWHVWNKNPAMFCPCHRASKIACTWWKQKHLMTIMFITK